MIKIRRNVGNNFGGTRMSLIAVLITTLCSSACSPVSQPVTDARSEWHATKTDRRRGYRLPTETEARALGVLTRAATKARALPLLQPLDVRIQTGEQIRQSMLKEVDQADIDSADNIYKTIGLLAEETDTLKLLADVLGEQILGYYDHKKDVLVIRQDVVAEGRSLTADRETRMVIVHEITHALQDQHFGIKNFDKGTGSSHDSDHATAYDSVVEGDATLAMFVDMLASMGVELPRSELARKLDALPMEAMGGGGGNELKNAPPILRVTLTFPYIAGLKLSAQAYARAGWAGVNALHENPPTTTRTVIHLHDAPHAPRPLALDMPQTLKADGWQEIESDALGELEVGIYLAHGTAKDRDASAAEGLMRDRIKVYRLRKEGKQVRMALWHLTWQTPAEAERAFQAAQHHPDKSVWRHRAGNDLIIVHGFDGLTSESQNALRSEIKTRLES